MVIEMNVNKEDIAHVLPMMAMDSVSDAGSDALRITGLVKSDTSSLTDGLCPGNPALNLQKKTKFRVSALPTTKIRNI